MRTTTASSALLLAVAVGAGCGAAPPPLGSTGSGGSGPGAACYTFVDAGRDVVCAIRSDGTSGCWRHDLDPDPDATFGAVDVTHLDPIVPAVDPDW